jgi:hypothetical protein
VPDQVVEDDTKTSHDEVVDAAVAYLHSHL